MTAFCTYSALLVYLSAIVCLTVFKYKIRGFTLHLLVGQEIAVIALWIELIVFLRMNRLLTEDPSPSHELIMPELLRKFKISYSFFIVATTIGISIFWIFALKYWSVALKFQLVVNE